MTNMFAAREKEEAELARERSRLEQRRDTLRLRVEREMTELETIDRRISAINAQAPGSFRFHT